MKRYRCILVLAFLMSLCIAPFSVFAWPVPDTGQTTCYDVDGNVISCDGTGQDGAYEIDPPSYTKLNESGGTWTVVKDEVTGLYWEVKVNCGGVNYENPHCAENTYTWYDPNPATNGGNAGTPGDGVITFDTRQFIQAMNDANFGGFSDWRMPEREELRSIVDYGIPSPGPTIDTGYLPNPVSSYYWSSSTDAVSPGSAWSVLFSSGISGNGLKSVSWYARAVRGGQ